jgi:dTDP-4-amino-4,6-dideoxygalactose transaminase
MRVTKVPVPFLDLKAQYQSLKPALDDAVIRVLESGRYVLGPEVSAFETEFAQTSGTRHAVGVSSGTSALHLALLALGVGPGDEVVTVPFTFVATVAAILYAGAKPVLVDVEPATLTLDPNRLEQAITPRTRAILPVHIHGQPADMGPIMEIAERRGVPVVEDAAQSHAAEYCGRRAGSIGVLGCFSFYPGKNLGAAGEGGAVTTDDDDLAKKVRMLRDWGSERKYVHQLHGFNYRLEEIQAAILRVKLTRLEAWTEARRSHAALYQRLLAGGPVALPIEAPGRRHVYHVFAVQHPSRDALAGALERGGVATGIHYPVPVHLQPAYEDLGYGPGDFPVAERATREVLSLPMFPELTAAQVEEVSDLVSGFRD